MFIRAYGDRVNSATIFFNFFNKLTRVGVLSLTLILSVFLNGCTKKPDTATVGQNETQKNATGTTGPAVQNSNREVNLAIWANYLTPEQQKKFTDSTGIKLKISHFSSNEELLAKIQSGASGIDVAVPSDYMVQVMTKMSLLEKLGPFKEKLTSEILKEFLGLTFDPKNEFSLPYAWSSTGIAYNKDLFQGKISSWKDFLNLVEVDNKFSLLDDSREVISLGLKSQGFSINSIKEAELETAKQFLLKLKKKVKMFKTETIDALVKKEVAIAHAYSLDALQANDRTGGKIGFVFPEEGSPMAIDNLVIVKGAKNVKESEELIQFLLSLENNISFVQRIFGGPVLAKTKNSLPKNLQENEILFPQKKIFSKLERLEDIGDFTKFYDRVWTEIKSQ